MPYTNPVEIPTLKTEIDKFKAIADEAAISPVVLGNLLYQLASHINQAAAAFGVPPNIPYAETFKLEVLENAVKLKFTYRQPDGYDKFPELTIPLAGETKGLAGLMSADDKRMLGIAASLAQSMQAPGDEYFQWATTLRDWFGSISEGPVEVLVDLNAEPTVDEVYVNADKFDIMAPDAGLSDSDTITIIQAATTETAGVMTATDKARLDTLFDSVGSCNLPIDALTEPGYYRLTTGEVIAVSKSAVELVNPTTAKWTVTQTMFAYDGIQSRSAEVVKSGKDVTKSGWTEWKPQKMNLRVGLGLDLSEDDELTLTARAKQMLFDDMWTAAVGSYGKVDHTHTESRDGKEVPTPYYLNELWLTYDEAIAVYDAGPIYAPTYGQSYSYLPIRTNLPPFYSGRPTLNMLNFARWSTIEVLNLAARGRNFTDVEFYTGNNYSRAGQYMVDGASMLKKIIGNIDLRNAAKGRNYIIGDCPVLEAVNLFYARHDVLIGGCPKLSANTIRGLITRRIDADNLITVTVHKNVYAKLTADEENEAYASLSIQEKNEWAPLLELAESYNITFASA
jgi:hypothetical protein